MAAVLGDVHRRYSSYSVVGARARRASTASAGVASPPTTAATCPVIGISTPNRSASARRRGRGGRPLDHLSHPFPRLVRGAPRREGEPEAPVARLVVGAGEDEVAETGKPHQGGRAGPDDPPETQHLAETPGNDRGPGVGPEPEPVRDSRGYREDVLDRTAQGDPGHVVIRVGAKARAVEQRRDATGAIEIGACDGHRGGESRRDLAGERRPRHHGGPRRGAKSVHRHLVQPPSGTGVDSLGRPRDAGTAPGGPRHPTDHLPERVARHHDQGPRGPPPPPAPARSRPRGRGERRDRGDSVGSRSPRRGAGRRPYRGPTAVPEVRFGPAAGRARSPMLRRREPRSPAGRSVSRRPPPPRPAAAARSPRNPPPA